MEASKTVPSPQCGGAASSTPPAALNKALAASPTGNATRSLFAALPDHAGMPMDSIEASLRGIIALGQVLEAHHRDQEAVGSDVASSTHALDPDTVQELCELQSRLAGRALTDLFQLAGNLMRGGA